MPDRRQVPNRAPELRVQLTKRPDGGAVLRCVRADGSATWQRQDGPRAMFFPFHDLTHLAVESTLGFRAGFYGLIADGWDIDDTGGKGRRGRLPPEAVLVEHVVGLFDRERVGGAAPLSAAERGGAPPIRSRSSSPTRCSTSTASAGSRPRRPLPPVSSMSHPSATSP